MEGWRRGGFHFDSRELSRHDHGCCAIWARHAGEYLADEVAGPPGFPLYGHHRSRREGDFILKRMRRLLGEFGTDLGRSRCFGKNWCGPALVVKATYGIAL